MSSLTTLLAQGAPLPPSDVGGQINSGLQAGMNLATAKEQVEQKKVQLEQQKSELVMKQAATANSLLTNLARANPAIAKKMLPQIREKLINLGVDPEVADYTISDDANRKRQVAFGQYASSGLTTNKQFAQEYFSTLGDVLGYDQAAQMFDRELARKQQDKQFAIQQSKIDAQMKKDNERIDRQDEKLDRQDTEKLSKRLTADSIPEVVSALNGIDQKLDGGLYSDKAVASLDEVAGIDGFVASFKVPFTQVVPLENSVIDEKYMPLYQDIAGLRNAYLKLRSGGAVTDPEANRFLAELGQGSIRSGKQLQNGLKRLNEAVRTGLKSIEGGYNPEVVARYKENGGTVSSDALPGQRQQSASKAPAPNLDLEAKRQEALKHYSPEEVDAFIQKNMNAQKPRR